MSFSQHFLGFTLQLSGLSLLVTLCVIQPACAKLQSPKCTLDKSQSPELLGLRLGMSREQIQNRFSGLTIRDASQSGDYTEIFLTGSSTLPKDQDVSATDEVGRASVNTARFPEFAGVSDVKLRLKDGRVSLIEVTYPDASKWESADAFVSHVAHTFHLPNQREWESGDRVLQGGQGAHITCNGFSVDAGFKILVGSGPAGPAAIAIPLIRVEDTDAR